VVGGKKVWGGRLGRKLFRAWSESRVNFVSKVQEIEAALQQLSPGELRQVREWLEDFIEDQLEFTDTAKAAIEEAERELAAGIKSRVRQP
jgi:hypothetical protein